MNLIALCFAIVVAANAVLAVENCETQDPTLALALAFENADIVPDIIPQAPPAELTVSFDSVDVELGNLIYPVRTILPPTVEFAGAKPKTLYTLIIIDCDVPSRAGPALRCYLYSLCVNIKGSQFNEESGFAVAPYLPISPAPGSGEHRIIALLYEQSCYIDTNCRALIDLGVNRIRFNLAEFLNEYKIGDLVAGNFWVTEIPKCYDRCCICDK